MKCVFLVTGVHGVGKSYFLNKVKENLEVPIYGASSLIRQYGTISDVNKRVSNSVKNQNDLLESIRYNVKDNKFILDGHTVLINGDGNFEKISENVFAQMNLQGIIFVFDSPKKIVERLMLRDGKIYTEEEIFKFQELEIKHSRYISEILNIPLFMYENGTSINEVIAVIKEWFDE